MVRSLFNRCVRWWRCSSNMAYRRWNLTPSLFSDKTLLKDYKLLIPQKDDEIIVAMSSGVDSSVAASLYAQKYNNVRGIYMANWTQTARCTEQEWNDVQRVSDQLNIPCERVNFEKEYWNDIFQPMILMYQKGLTPNPDVGCNRYIKFGKMIDHLSQKFDKGQKWWLVTGHYARIMKHIPSGRYHLLRASYLPKDQSFYLSSIPLKVLHRVLMPIAHLTKPEVRRIAESKNLYTAKKPDSQGLCFVSQEDKNFRNFLDNYIEPNEGNIITEDGKIWGKHRGLWHATIGQRAGVSMPQGDKDYKGTWFISAKRFKTNELVIVKGNNNESLFNKGLEVVEWQWLADEWEQELNTKGLTIQFRSLQEPCVVNSIESDGNSKLKIHLESRARAMAPGQNIVLYRDLQVLGSGILEKTFD